MKKKRLRIAVLFNFRRGWMGGIIYIINLINALNWLDDDEKPEVILIYNKDLAEFLPQINYPHLKTVEWSYHGFSKGYLVSWLKWKNIFIDAIVTRYQPDGIYPLNDWPVSGKRYQKVGTRIVAWIPDLQHKFYPHFFGRLRVFLRELRIRLLLKNAGHLAVSSKDVEGHFKKFYRVNGTPRIHVLKFASIAEPAMLSSSAHEFRTVREKYGVPQEYFMVSNQFTNHKNHPVIFKALKLLADKGMPRHFVFTGKMEFPGNEKYIAGIRELIRENSLEGSVSLLGVIPRMDQLILMKHAKAIVQPSLFEGWSTVIEDAKTLDVPVIASDLPVNIEQLGDRGVFFNRHDEASLAESLISFSGRSPVGYEKYDDRVKAFAESFVRIFK